MRLGLFCLDCVRGLRASVVASSRLMNRCRYYFLHKDAREAPAPFRLRTESELGQSSTEGAHA